jgi:hypothetical protein
MGDMENFSPFDVGWGRHVNCMEIGMGEDQGFMKIHSHGVLEIWGTDADPLGPPSITFNPDSAELLMGLAQECVSRKAEYENYLREQQREPGDEEQEPESVLTKPQPIADQAPAKKPQIVAGAAAGAIQ